MIASLRGTVLSVRLNSAVIDVAGVGYRVQATPATLALLRVGEQSTLATLQIVREDSIALYGFSDDDERDVFESVQTVSGVGPRLALAMLAVHTPNGLRSAVANEDLAALKRVPGIGHKGAQRIVLELAGKLGAPEATSLQAPIGEVPRGHEDVVEALVSLGWSSKLAQEAVAAVSDSEATEPFDVASHLRAALQHLGGNRG